jgi:diadenosine tetraphosphate (Ap4A) HIT family hydrolase
MNEARGYTVAFFRGRHVAEATELTDEESVGFWREVLRVQRALEERYAPMKINILIMGNAMPHLHAHIVPRYADDPDGGEPPRFMMGSDIGIQLDDAPYEADVAALRALLAG